jgi:hypothetical protein
MSQTPLITSEAVVTLLIGAGDVGHLSAQLWPLELALEDLEQGAEAESVLRRAVERMPQASVRNGLRFTGLRRTIHSLVQRRLLIPGGSGWEAGYAVSDQLRRDGRVLASAFGRRDQDALTEAAQALIAATRMASKNPAASAPSGSVTI